MPTIIRPIKANTTAAAPRSARIALVQIDYNPAYRYSIDYLAEPLGLDVDSNSAISTLRLADRSVQEVVNTALAGVRRNYLAHLRCKLRAILTFLAGQHVDLVCFPEYCIPPDLIPEALDFSKHFGMVLPSHTATIGSLRLLGDLFGAQEIGWTQGHALFIAVPQGGDGSAYLLAKVTRSKFEPTLTPATETAPVALLGPVPVLVLMCSDFLQGRDVQSAAQAPNPAAALLGSAPLRVVCAMTPSTEPFFDLATQDLLRSYSMKRLPTAFVNHAAEGGTSVFALMESDQVLEARDQYSSYRIPSSVEAVGIFDIVLGPQLDVKPSSLTPEPRSKLTNLHVIQEAGGSHWPEAGRLAQEAGIRTGATAGVLRNIDTALDLIADVVAENARSRFEPIRLLSECGTLAWRMDAARELLGVLRSVIPSLDMQDRQLIETRLQPLENLAPAAVAPTTIRGAPPASARIETPQESEEVAFDETDGDGVLWLTLVTRLTRVPSSAPIEDVIGPLRAILSTVVSDRKLTIDVRYEILQIADLGAETVLTDLSIELFIIARYGISSGADRTRAEVILRDLRLLLQTGFGDLYRFTPVSRALRDKYLAAQEMKYRVSAGHAVSTSTTQARLIPYRGQPDVSSVLRFLFARRRRASLRLGVSAIGDDALPYAPFAGATPITPAVAQSSDKLGDALRTSDLFELFRPSPQDESEHAYCRVELSLELPEPPSRLVPEMLLHELLGDSFVTRTATRVNDQWIEDGPQTSERLHDVASIREALSLLRLPTGDLPTFGDRTSAAALQVPFEVAENSEGCLIGHAFHQDSPQSISVYLSPEDRRKHVYVVGKTGAGKTQFLLNMIMQDINSGNGVCVMDPHGDLFEDVLRRFPAGRLRDLVVFDPTDHENPPGLNLFEYDRRNPMHRDFVLDEAVAIFLRIHGNEMFGPRIQNYFRNGALALMTDPSRERTLLDMARLFLDDDFFDYVMNVSADPAVIDFLAEFKRTASREKDEMIPYFQAKWAPFVSNAGIRNVVGQPRSTLNFRQAMDKNHVVLINLSKGKLGELNSRLLGMVLVSKVTWAALSRAYMPAEQRSDFYLYCDEFQNFATDTFSTVLSEARKYGLCLTLAHQFLSQLRISDNFTNVNRDSLRDAVLGNVGNVVVFKVGSQDAKALTEEIAGDARSKEKMAALLSTQPRFRAVVRLDCRGLPTHPFTLTSRLTDAKEDPKQAALVREYVVRRSTLPREFVLADIASARTDYRPDTGQLVRRQRAD